MSLTRFTIGSVKGFLRDSIAYGSYQIGSDVFHCDITEKKYVSDDRLEISLNIGGDGAGVITNVSLYDAQGNKLVSQTENITVTATDGLLYKFHFAVGETQF